MAGPRVARDQSPKLVGHGQRAWHLPAHSGLSTFFLAIFLFGASAQEQPAHCNYDLGNGAGVPGIYLDGKCIMILNNTTTHSGYSVSITSKSLPKCDDGYELVARLNMKPVCARDFKQPH